LNQKKNNNQNISWYNGHILRKDREKLHGHSGLVVWFTGLSASGKSTIAHTVERVLYNKGYSTYVFDGDNVRHGLCADLGFSLEDRKENIRRIGEMIKLFVDAGVIVLTAFISPLRADREKVRLLFKPGEFIETYIKCPIEVCSARDGKGMYERAKRGEIKNFTGISSPYEEPESPELIIETQNFSIEESCSLVIDYIIKTGLLKIKNKVSEDMEG
jgi:adenylylsulfate kinase